MRRPNVRSRYRIGTDIGGTFTDIVLMDDATGRFWSGKRLTTPSDPSDAVADGVREVLAEASVEPATVGHFMHATTLATNALIQRKGSPTALVTTKGFRDVLEVRDEGRYDLFDLGLELPPPLVERDLRFEVDERVAADGEVLRPLDTDSVKRVAELIAASGVRTVAVSLLHSYQFDEHEQTVRQYLCDQIPGLRVSVSSEVAPEIREYQRTSTTVANAYVQPLLEGYLDRLRNRITDMGIDAEILVMLSSGGVCTLDSAKAFPVRLVESGPASGAILAAAAGRLLARPSLSSFDMGGTTAKSCLIVDGEPHMSQEFETARVWRFKKGSGLPLRTPVIELIEIGAGGGSIASANVLGTLDIGPESAGASPGPACYGKGGSRPTVTDADLVLGYLDSEHFLGGTMRLDRDAAERAILEHVATPLGLDLVRAAWAIHAKVNEAMAAAARLAAVERGGDPSAYPLFAFGGAGPVHAYGVGSILRAPEVVIGVGPGVGSALGLLSAPVAFDIVRSHLSLLDETDWSAVADLARGMITDGRALLSKANIDQDRLDARLSVDMRYQGQGYEIEVDSPLEPDKPTIRSILMDRFESAYRKRYGQALDGVPIEIINWRCRVSGPSLGLPPAFLADDSRLEEPEVHYRRPAYFDGVGIVAETPVFDRAALRPSHVITGPAIIEEADSTTLVGPSASAEVHRSGSLVLRLSRGEHV